MPTWPTTSEDSVHEADTDPRVGLLVVTGSGRSGTSTVAGTLKRLGLHVPQPEQPADESNPRGFYEPMWVVDFHKRLLKSVPARTNDARPGLAEDLRLKSSLPEVRDELRSWLTEQAQLVGPGGQLLVKDPRTFWVSEMWSEVADELDIDLRFLTMLRHPAEVVQSRETYYLTDQTDAFRRTRQIANLAGWVNSAYQTEVATRQRPRCFVRYADLLTDWRATMLSVRSQLGLRYNADLTSSEHHAVDDFIDVSLNRSRVDWDGIATMPQLLELAALTWDACERLVEAPYDEEAVRVIDAAHDHYVTLHEYAEAITLDHTNVKVVREHWTMVREGRAKRQILRERLERKRQQVAQLRAELAQLRADLAQRTEPAPRRRWRR
jgi:hypothetical protein